MAGLLSNFTFSTLTLNDLVQIDAGRMDRAAYLIPTLDKVYHIVRKETIWDKVKKFFQRGNTSINMYYTVFAYNVSSPSGGVYRVLIEIQPNFNRAAFFDNVARVYCNCADFKFRYAWELNKRKNLFRNSRISQELGIALQQEPTDKTKNSSGGSHMCKHVYAAVKHLADNYDQIIASI